MLTRLKNFFLIDTISKSFIKKIMTITLVGLLLGFIISLGISNQGLIQLKIASVDNFKDQLDQNNQVVLQELLNNTSYFIDKEIVNITNELKLARDISQTKFDQHAQNPDKESTTKHTIETLIDNGRYLQNSDNQSSVLLVQGYLLDSTRKPNAETTDMIAKTEFFNELLPNFLDSDLEKLQVYFTGKPKASIYRVAPWINLGQTFDEIYPAHNNQPNWEAFYPGLISQWEDSLIRSNGHFTVSTPIFTSPSQDAATGDVVISIKTAIWNINRTSIEGTISYDLSLDQLVQRIQDIYISKNSFAFLSQSNGNLFALNNMGSETLGLKNDTAFVQSKSDALKLYKRSFKDSAYNAVQNIRYPSDKNILIQKITINEANYWVMSKKLSPFKIWDGATGLNDETWVLGFVVPEADFSPPYQKILASITNSSKSILLTQAAIIMLIFAFITSVIFLVYENLTRNFSMLIRATEQIKKRNFDVSVKVDSQDEFSVLAQSFNDMTNEIRATVNQLTTQNEVLKGEMDLKNRMDEQIAYMKQYDHLTGLPNKQSFYRKLDEYCHRAISENRLGALVVIGLDNFKGINEAYGIEIGDELLKQVAERLRNEVGADSVARITGDEYGLIFYGMTVLDDLITRLDHLKDVLGKQFVIGNNMLYMTATYGITSFPEDSTNPKELIKFATSALLNAKSQAKDQYRFYDSNIEKNIKNKVDLMNALRQCIDNNELKLVYQPIIDVSTGKYVGVEALLRWHNMHFGFIPPNIFIPLAEEINFISQIERWVIKQAIHDIELLNANHIQNIYMSINLSAIDLESNEFMDYVEEQIMSNQLPHGSIQLEITEGVLINKYDQLVPRLRKLAKLGVRIALDDFGTGYSSLKYIKRLPIDCLKIDRSFVKDYPDYDDGSIARIIINLAKTLNLKVIAEGVETKQQADFLSTVDCTLHQGYYYSKGILLEQFIEICHQNNQ